MDVVYYVRPGDRNEELRYSLRSLDNLPHDRVWIVGHTPPWVTGVESVPGNVVKGAPQAVAQDNLRRACSAVDVERFVIFNDDFYVTEPIDEVPSWHAGPLDEKVARTRGGYGNTLREALRQLTETGYARLLAWTLHIPVVVIRSVLSVVLDGIRPGRVLPEWRTMYGNIAGATGEQAPDCKVMGSRSVMPDGPFLSSLDGSFGLVLPRLRDLFPEPCRYEVPA